MSIEALVIAAIILLIYLQYTGNYQIGWGNGIFSRNPPELTEEQKKELLPTSGYEYPYSPVKWNIPPIVFYHNCYDYAFDNYNIAQFSTSQPGFLKQSGDNESGGLLTCAAVNDRISNDHVGEIRVADAQTPCGQGEYKIALVTDPDDDYHFLRQNRDGTWSHKPGSGFVTNKDFAGNIILNPQKAMLKGPDIDYNNFCNYFCVNRNIKNGFS